MKYKVTTRGWIVFSIASLIVLFSIYNIGRIIFTDSESDLPAVSKPIDTDVNEDSSEVITDAETDETEDLSTTTPDENTDSPDENTDSPDENTDSSDENTDSLDENNDSSDETDDDTDEEAEIIVTELDMNKRSEIIFDKNVALLETDDYAALDEWVSLLTTQSSIEITIEGHINGFPYYDDGPYGLSISKERAMVIYNYLIDHDVDESQLDIINLGSNDQAIMTSDVSKHYLNRRAVIYINKN